MTTLTLPPLDRGLSGPALPPLDAGEDAAPDVAASAFQPPTTPGALLRAVLQDREALLAWLALAPRQTPLARLVAVAALMTAFAGLALGAATSPLQALSAAVKAPLVNLGALAVCLPAFYLLGALTGARTGIRQTLGLFAAGLGLRGAVLAALAPLLLLFSGVGSPYGFLLVIALLAFGAAELAFLRTLDQGVAALRARQPGTYHPALVRVWMLVYLAVTVQVTWSLRPLIQHPEIEGFTLLGGHGNIYTYFLRHAWPF